MTIVYTERPVNFPKLYFNQYPSILVSDPLVNKLTRLFSSKNTDNTDADCLKNAIFIYDEPIITNERFKIHKSYPSLDNDKTVIKKTVKYYYHKLLEKYIQDDMYDLLGYLKIDGDKVEFIKSMDEYQQTIEPSYKDLLKIKFIKENILSRRLVYKLLKMFIKKYHGKWYKLGVPDIEKYVVKFLHEKLKELFENQIKK